MNNRQAGRRRGRGGQRPQGGTTPNRQDNGNRIDSRARGNAAQLLEKYKNLARDSQMQGDRVNTEYYLQFADHYFRVLNETRARFEENNPQARRPSNDIDDDDDFEMDRDDGIPEYRDPREDRAATQARDGNRDHGRENARENGRDNGGRDNNGNREARDTNGGRDHRENGHDRGRDQARDANRDSSRENGRGESARVEAGDHRRDAGRDQPRREPRVEAPRAQPVREEAPVVQDEAPRPRRGRPPRPKPEPVAESVQDQPEAVGIEADRLPPSLGFANDAGEAPPAEKPRRRRRVRGEDGVLPPVA